MVHVGPESEELGRGHRKSPWPSVTKDSSPRGLIMRTRLSYKVGIPQCIKNARSLASSRARVI